MIWITVAALFSLAVTNGVAFYMYRSEREQRLNAEQDFMRLSVKFRRLEDGKESFTR